MVHVSLACNASSCWQDRDVTRILPLEALVAVHLVIFLGWLLGSIWWMEKELLSKRITYVLMLLARRMGM